MTSQQKYVIENECLVLHEGDSDFAALEELENGLLEHLEKELAELEFLQKDREKISSPEALGETIKNVVWEQFLNQIAVTAGADFIKENRGLTLDLSKDAHIQTTENFAKGKIAKHNTEIDFQQRYDDWQANFVKDENGNVVTHPTRSGKEEATLVKGARRPYDKGRPAGSQEKGTAMDHTISAGEIIRDPAAAAHMTEDERIGFANSSKNLNEMPADQNSSKGDTPMKDWLDNPNRKGQKPHEIFDINSKDDATYRAKDEEARAEFERLRAEAEKRSGEAGKRSRRVEAQRISGKAIRAVVMQLLAELIRKIVAKLVAWFKSGERKLESLLAFLKEAICSFVSELRTHLINGIETALTTIASAIWGPIISTIKKVWIMLKQGWKSLKEAIAYLKDPKNRNKSVGVLMLEVGKIVMAGLSAVGAIVLSEVIEKALISIPGVGVVFAFEIPLIGSLANILGIFLGAVVAGIVGAIAINCLQKKIGKMKERELVTRQIDKGNEILQLQTRVQSVAEKKLGQIELNTASNIGNRHQKAGEEIRATLDVIAGRCEVSEGEMDDLNQISNGLDDLLQEV